MRYGADHPRLVGAINGLRLPLGLLLLGPIGGSSAIRGAPSLEVYSRSPGVQFGPEAAKSIRRELANAGRVPKKAVTPR
jgi:hypothetical protein